LFIYSRTNSDLSITYSHNANIGNFVYGTYSEVSYANGIGGTSGTNSNYITALDNQVVSQYVATDSFTGFPMLYTLYFRLSDTSLQESAYVVAGTIILSECIKVNNSDALSIVYLIDSKRITYADGIGGSYQTDNFNTAECGYYPNGYYISYSYNESNYGNTNTYQMATGDGGVTVGASSNNYYESGYIFYYYYDDATSSNMYYRFDGYSGYYITNM
jgi:hypothetical protein